MALLVESLYEDLGLWYPLLRLREAGAEVTTVENGATSYTSKHGYPAKANACVDRVSQAHTSLKSVRTSLRKTLPFTLLTCVPAPANLARSLPIAREPLHQSPARSLCTIGQPRGMAPASPVR
jgi:hypothetical protein